MADDMRPTPNRASKDALAGKDQMAEHGKRDERTESTENRNGRARDRSGGSRSRDAVAWAVAAAIVVLGGGAAAYLYGHGRAEAPAAGAVAAATGSSKGLSQPPKVASAQTTKGIAQAKTGAQGYEPQVGSPVAPVNGPVVEGYGWQYQKSLGLYRDVPGWALAAAEGTPVKAVLGGRVVANWVDPTEGREVVINSKNGDSIIYGDLEGPGPAVGTTIQAGEAFAKVGTPGKLSGVREPHLFLEVTMNGEPQDPATLLPEMAPPVHTGSTSPTAGA